MMKVLAALILTLAVMQAFALPRFEDPLAPEHMPEDSNLPEFVPRNEVVENFRRDIDSWFLRYTNFYDRTNAQMRDYRLAHVVLVTDIYNRFMEVFGDSVEAHVQLSNDLIAEIAERETEAGGINTCLQTVIDDQEAAAIRIGAIIQGCATTANTTLSVMLRDQFYPAFAAIQTSTSAVPTFIIDVLSRGNVLQDEQAIINYIALQYQVFDLQWTSAVSQLLTWETARFTTEGLFNVDEARNCMAEALIDMITSYSEMHLMARGC